MPESLLNTLLDKGILIALLFWMFLQERKERIAAQRKKDDCLEQKVGEVAR